MPKFKPPTPLNLASSVAEAFDSQKTMPSLAESLQFSPGGVKRLKGEDTFSVEIHESDLIFLSTLGAGASSTVHKALLIRQGGKQRAQPKYVAVKKISNLNEDLRKQMKKDVSILMDATKAKGCLDTPMEGLVAFEGAYMNDRTQEVAIVLEYMNGGSLADTLRRKERIPEAVLAKIALMVLKGLFHLHKQMHIVHRDIKPANILLNMDGVAKISDFGISRNLENTLDCCNTYQGTAVYMSPERLQSQPYGFASDIWSLGLCLVECATGKYPYDASGGPVTVMTYIIKDEAPLPPKGDFSDELRDFCRRCLQRNPNDRASAIHLMSHPFILNHRSSTVDMPAFMQSAVDPQTSFDEVSFFFAHQYYQLLSTALCGDTVARSAALRAIAPLYQNESIYTFTTDSRTKSVSRGRTEIEAQLERNVRVLQGFGVTGFEVKKVDCSGMSEMPGGVLLHVRGSIIGKHGSNAFAEMFALVRKEQLGGVSCFCVAHQSFASFRT